jgi:hypothetical protein
MLSNVFDDGRCKKTSRLRTATLALSIMAVVGLLTAASAFAAGSISGTATAADTGGPISGLSVCAEANFIDGVSSGCTHTDGAGHYTISGLAARPDYQVEFSPLGDLNFITQYFQGKEGLNNWDRVTVNDGSTTERIDAVMKPGAQVAGHVSEQGTEAPAKGVQVCVLDPAPNPRAEEFERCAHTDSDGDYMVRSLPAGTYIVAFAPSNRSTIDSTPYAAQYSGNATTKAAATSFSVTPPETKSGVNGSLVNRLQTALRPVDAFRAISRDRGAKVSFRFSGGGFADSFVCKRDGASWRPCRSPQQFWASVGRHAFRVRAISSTGDKGPIALDRFHVSLGASAQR